ncbi:MAG: hypothetical protein ABSB19_18255 [Methylomonas sp.]|jgi:hypothetical protein
MMRNRRDLLIFCAKMLLAWSALTCLTLLSGAWMLTALFPLFKAIIVIMTPEFMPSLKYAAGSAGGGIELSVWVMRSVAIGSQTTIPKGVILPSAMHLLHILLPVVIQFSIILVWPLQNFRQRLILIVLGILAAILLLSATVPALLIALAEMPFQQHALELNPMHPAPWFMDWMVFCEMGGAMLLAVCAAFVCIAILQIASSKLRD